MKFYRIKLHDELLLIYSGGICLQPLFRTKFKRFHKRKAIIISIIGLMIVFLVMINWWFIIYLKQIESIDEISLQVKQGATVDLPKTVKAKLRNNEYKTVAVSRIIVDNELLEEYEVRKSIYKVQTLPSKVLERLLEGKVTIEYIHEDITDLPEFERLKEYESDNLKVFGAFKYPKIVVDSQALDYIQFAKIDTFSTIVLHEIGHSYDYLFDKNDESNKFDLSNKKEFEDIWKEEGARLFNTRVTGMTKEQNQYYINYQYEFFAESFAFYFDSEESKRTLLEYAPRTYNFIDKHVN